MALSISSLHVTVDDCVYMSAPSSPTNDVHRQKVCFYSAPTSPTESSFEIRPQPLKSLGEESNFDISKFDEFEFDTKPKFKSEEEETEEIDGETGEIDGETEEIGDHQSFVKAWKMHRQRPRGESMPAISFGADDEKMVQVKLPPRLHSISSIIPASPRSADHRSPTSVYKFPFMHQNLWNDDYDPFMEALKKTAQEEKKAHRRTRSMLPLRSYYSWKKSEPEAHSGPQLKTLNPKSNELGLKEETKAPLVKLSEPRGVMYCRRARLVKVGQETSRKTWMKSAESGGNKAAAGGSKRHSKIKKFLLKIIYESSKQKGQIGTASKKKNQSTGRFSVKLTQIKEEDEVEMTKMALARYKQPKFALCMGGYAGMKYVK